MAAKRHRLPVGIAKGHVDYTFALGDVADFGEGVAVDGGEGGAEAEDKSREHSASSLFAAAVLWPVSPVV